MFEVVALLDAAGPFFEPRDKAFPDATAADWAAAEAIDPDAFGPDGAWSLVFHAFAIRGPTGRIILVDAGVGPQDSPASTWAPVPGRLPDALAEAGIDRDDVEAVVLTHLHTDHFGWAVGSMFPNARFVIQSIEVAALAQDSPATRYVVEPLRRSGQLDLIDGRQRLARRSAGSVTVEPTPGHTVGHQSVVVESRHRQLVITGDVLVHAVQLANADVAYRHESDPEQARDTRRALLTRARRTNALLATAHLTQPFVPVS